MELIQKMIELRFRNLIEKRSGTQCTWCAKEKDIINLIENQLVCPDCFEEIKKDYDSGNKQQYLQMFKYKQIVIKIEEEGKESNYLWEKFLHSTNFIECAKEFISKQPIWYDKSKLWWAWDFKKKCWNMVDEIDILNVIDHYTSNPSTNARIRNEWLEALKRVGRQQNIKPIKKTWIQFEDQIIDIKDGTKTKALPKYFVTNPIPWKIGKSQKTPTMDKIFKEWVGEDYVKTLYQIIAYSLLPDYPLHRIFCFVGGGLNGKSCYQRLIRTFLGSHNITSTELDILLNSRFEITRLHKKLVCMMGETNFNEMSKTSILKNLSGQDLIGFEYKNKDPFVDINYAKIIISTNNLPSTTDKTVGFYRRWIIIDFPNRFNESKDILADIPKQEYNNLARKSVNILKELLIDRKFHKEGSIEDRAKKYEDKSNPFEKFWRENIERSGNDYIFKWKLREVLVSFCQENNLRRLSDYVIAQNMKERGIQDERIENWAWVGIKLK